MGYTGLWVAQNCLDHLAIQITSDRITKGKGKGKVQPRTGHEGPEEEQRYISILSFTSQLDGVGRSTLRPDYFTLGKETQHPLYCRLAGPQGWSGQVRKI
jgi:hypothetical protein